jgi:hypothetical protein
VVAAAVHQYKFTQHQHYPALNHIPLEALVQLHLLGLHPPQLFLQPLARVAVLVLLVLVVLVASVQEEL